MKQVLDQLISEAPEDNNGAAQIQLQIGGANYAGAVRKSPRFDGDIYEIMTVGQRPSKIGGAVPFMVTVYFRPESVEAIHVPSDDVNESKGPSIPGLEAS